MQYQYGSKAGKQADPYGSKQLPREYRAGLGGAPSRNTAVAESIPAGVGKYTCDICGKHFDVAVAMAGHKRSHRNGEDKS